MSKNLILLFFSLLFSALLAEGGARYFFPEASDAHLSTLIYEDQKLLNDPNHREREVKKLPNNQTLYDALYQFDQFGRRVTPDIKSKKAAIFFGGSFLFGDGLNDEETFAWLYSKEKGIKVYNYGGRGQGPHHMLSMIKEEGIENQISPEHEKVDAYFWSYHFHTERYLGAMDWMGRQAINGPYYELDKLSKKVVFQGNFGRNRKFKSLLYWSLYQSVLVRTLFKNLGDDKGALGRETLCGFMNSAEEELRNRFKKFGTLYLVISPFQELKKREVFYKGIKNCLSEGIRILDIRPPHDFDSDKKKYVFDPSFDLHPNLFANKWLADWLLENH